jgi:hypothetical protein
MINFGLSVLWLGLLYLSRGHLTKQLFRLVNSFGGGHRAFTVIWSIIFLPGTIIHEMSHFFAAAFTGTHIGEVEIFPTIPRGGIGADNRLPRPFGARNDEFSIHLGSVQTQQLGLFRGFVVGSAPFLIGLGLLMWLSSTFEISNFKFPARLRMDEVQAGGQISNFLRLYLFFTIANSLFLSWVDFKHALPLVIIIVILGAALYPAGIGPMITQDSFILEIMDRLQTALLWSVGINIAATGLIWGANMMRLPRRVTPRNDRL